jgi:hypothetical protein
MIRAVIDTNLLVSYALTKGVGPSRGIYHPSGCTGENIGA